MRGTAFTVFQGTKPEPMEVEVLGVLRNINGAKGDMPEPSPSALENSPRSRLPV